MCKTENHIEEYDAFMHEITESGMPRWMLDYYNEPQIIKNHETIEENNNTIPFSDLPF